jgi:hypothetical protein
VVDIYTQVDDDDAVHVAYWTIPLSFAASSWMSLAPGKGQPLPR